MALHVRHAPDVYPQYDSGGEPHSDVLVTGLSSPALLSAWGNKAAADATLLCQATANTSAATATAHGRCIFIWCCSLALQNSTHTHSLTHTHSHTHSLAHSLSHTHTLSHTQVLCGDEARGGGEAGEQATTARRGVVFSNKVFVQ